MNKITKILLLAVSALLLIGATFGIGAMATGGAEEPAHRIEIIANNLEYKDKINILYAVQVDGGNEKVAPSDITINFYLKQDNATEYAFSTSKKGEKAETIKVNGEDKAVYTLTSPGLAPKYMTKVIYAQAVVTIDGTEYKSEMSSFSIAEYCYKRLTVDADKLIEDQEGLYKSVLDFGTYAQKVLGYKTDETPADYYYVNASDIGMTVNSATIKDLGEYTFDHGIVKKDTAITLPESLNVVPDGMKLSGYSVATYGADYAATTETKAANDQLNITAHTVITATFENAIKHGGGVYFNNSDIAGTRYDFNSSTGSPENAGSLGVEHLGDNESKYMYLHKNNVEGNSNYIRYMGSDSTEADTSKVAVFEADIMFRDITANQGTPIKVRLYRGSAYNKYAEFFISTNADGKVFLRMSDWSTIAMLDSDPAQRLLMIQDEWYNLRIEFDNDGNTKIFVNGTLASTVTNTLKSSDTSARVLFYMQDPVDTHGLYIDNLFLSSACDPSN